MATTVTPQGTVSLCKTQLENDYKNQLTFSNATAQHNYFASTVQYTQNDCTYIKQDNVLYFDKNIDQIRTCNYLFYKNTGFTNKWFYCFITRMEYENENCTAVYFETDVFQTWQFDISYKRCFVEREHVNNDTFGLHTVPENFELGELTCNDVNRLAYADLNLNVLLVMAINKPLSPLTDNANTHMYGGVFSGLYYVAFHTPQDCAKCINQLDGAGQGAVIENIFILPNKLLNINSWSTIYIPPASASDTFEISAISNSNNPVRIIKDTIVTRNTTIDGYTPKNRKLFCWPFNYMFATNNGGQQAVFHYEDFANGNGDFDIVGTIAPGGSIRMIPRNYKNLGDDTDATACNTYGLTGAKYPTCAWVNDAYTNWLTQNAVNLQISLASSYALVGIGAISTAMGNPMGIMDIASGAMEIADDLKQMHQAEFMPNQANGNANSGDIQYSAHMMQFDVYQMSIKSEYAKIIDNYFTMFGYKVSTVKIPNITGRSNWNYVKTIDCNCDGNIPQEDLNKIKNMFNAGVTLWHNASTMLDYSQSNNIV